MFERVKEIMSKDPLCAKDTDDFWSVCEIMEEKGFSQIPINDFNGKVIGLFNEKSIFKCLETLKNGGSVKSISKFIIPIKQENKVRPDDYIDENLSEKLDKGEMVLVFDNYKLVGILTNSDLNKILKDTEPFRILNRVERSVREFIKMNLIKSCKNAFKDCTLKKIYGENLEQLNFSDLPKIIVNNTELFTHNLHSSNKKIFVKNLNKMINIRNAVMHSKGIDTDSTKTLKKLSKEVRDIIDKDYQGKSMRTI